MNLDVIRRLFGYKFPPLGRHLQAVVLSCLPCHIDTMLHPGIHVTLDLNDDTQRSTWWKGVRFEHPTGLVLCEWASAPDSLFFDIGSNYGFFSLMLLSQNSSLVAHAFEPNQTTFTLIEQIKQRNHLNRFHAWNLGLSNSHEKLLLMRGKADSGHSTFGEHPGLNPDDSVQVDVLPFDHWVSIQNIPYPAKPTWVAKIDVEGFELKVLEGMRSALLARAFRGLVVEINPYTLNLTHTKPAEIIDILSSCGYAIKEGFPLPAEGNAFFEPH